MNRIKFPIDSVKPCPFCGERLVLSSDHHGEWVAHRQEPGPCIFSVVQLMDAKDRDQWNTRAIDQSIASLQSRLQASEGEVRRLQSLIEDAEDRLRERTEQVSSQHTRIVELEAQLETVTKGGFDGIEAIGRDNAALRADAKRLDWLEQHVVQFAEELTRIGWTSPNDAQWNKLSLFLRHIRQAIDAAIAQPGSEKEEK